MKVYNFGIVIKNENIGLLPTNQETLDFLRSKLNNNEKSIYFVEKTDRNLKHLRKLFVIIDKFLENFDIDYTPEECLIYLKLKLGYYKYARIKGQIVMIPKSISFAEMSQDEFEKFYNGSVSIMAKALDVTKEQLENESMREL